MPINLASKFSPKVDERFKLGSLTQVATNDNYDWKDVDTVSVYSVDTSPLNNYQRTGTSRYGTPSELGDSVQAMKLTQDKSFTFIIDKGNQTSQMMVKRANKALTRQIDEVIIPYIDTYRIASLAAAGVANGAVSTAEVTPSNAFAEFLKGRAWMTNHKVPTTKRICFASADFINNIQLDSRFNLGSEKAQESNYNGFAGKASGVTFIEVPAEYLPENTDYVLTHPSVMPSPRKLQDYIIHDKPQGISGWLVEGRDLFDAFVLDSKVDAIYVHKNA